MLPDWILETVLSLQDIVDDLLVRFTAKGRLSAHHNKKNYAHGPIVTLGRVAPLEHFWSNIVRSTIRCSHDLVRTNTLRKTEIDELYV